MVKKYTEIQMERELALMYSTCEVLALTKTNKKLKIDLKNVQLEVEQLKETIEILHEELIIKDEDIIHLKGHIHHLMRENERLESLKNINKRETNGKENK